MGLVFDCFTIYKDVFMFGCFSMIVNVLSKVYGNIKNVNSINAKINIEVFELLKILKKLSNIGLFNYQVSLI